MQIKLLYLAGVVRPLPRLFALIEPTRRASLTPLHQTSVRNEHAYYCCIAQLCAIDRRYDYDVAAALADDGVLSFCGGCRGGATPGVSGEAAADPSGARAAAVGAAKGGDVSGASSSSDSSVVYMCGDSHALSTAWKSLERTVDGGGDGGGAGDAGDAGVDRTILVPALVTGLKHWHLRPGTNFYPKV